MNDDTRRSRRLFLATLGAAGAGSLLHGLPSAAQTPGTPARRIDIHQHFVSPSFYATLNAKNAASPIPGLAAWKGYSPASAVEALDRVGIATAMLSITAPGVWFGDVAQGRRLSRETSLYAAQMQQRHPKRFGFFAALPLPDIEGTLREIEYAFDQLHADGVVLMTSYGDRWLGDPSFDPVMQELERRAAVVYVHPGSPVCCSQLMSYVPPFLTEFTQDTNRTITSLMFSGQLARSRAIRFIFSHAGGTIPMLAGRIAQLSTSVPQLAAAVPDGVEAELRRLYYEVANSANRPAIAALLSLVPATQVMFGSDFPLVPIAATQAKLSGLGLSESDLASLSRGTAAKLFALADR